MPASMLSLYSSVKDLSVPSCRVIRRRSGVRRSIAACDFSNFMMVFDAYLGRVDKRFQPQPCSGEV